MESDLIITAFDLLIATLKLLVTVTNDSPVWCRALLSMGSPIVSVMMQCICSCAPRMSSKALEQEVLARVEANIGTHDRRRHKSSPHDAGGSSSLQSSSEAPRSHDERETSMDSVPSQTNLRFDLLCLCVGLLEGLLENNLGARATLRELGEF